MESLTPSQQQELTLFEPVIETWIIVNTDPSTNTVLDSYPALANLIRGLRFPQYVIDSLLLRAYQLLHEADNRRR